MVAADGWASALAVVLVAGSTYLAVGVPRHLGEVQREAVEAAVTAVGPLDRDLTGSLAGPLVSGPSADPAAPYTDLLRQVTAGPTHLLGGLAGAPDWSLNTPVMALIGRPRPGPVDNFVLQLGSGWPARVRFVAGRPPLHATPGEPSVEQRNGAPPRVPATIEIALAAEPAARMGLRVGDLLEVAARKDQFLPPLRLRLVGTYVARVPADPFWAPQPFLLSGNMDLDQNIGEIWTATVLTSSASLPVLQGELAAAQTVVNLRVPLRVDRIGFTPVAAVLSALRAAQSVPVTSTRPVLLSTGTVAALERFRRQEAPTWTVASVFLTSVLATASLVLLLLFQVLLDRKAPALRLAAARGASLGQALRQLAVQGLVLGAGGAVVGVPTALAQPGRTDNADIVMGAAVALAPALVLPFAALPILWAPRLRQWGERRGGHPRGGIATPSASSASSPSPMVAGSRGRVRGAAAGRMWRAARTTAWSGPAALELSLLVVCAASVVALRSRGLAVNPTTGDQSDGGSGRSLVSGADLLVATAPLLVALVGAVIARRVLSVVLALAAGLTARGRGLIVFLGSARAGRDAVLGPLGLAVVVLALATSVLAAEAAATLRVGARRAAVAAVGADLRVRGYGFGAPQASAVARLPGVRRVVLLTEVDDAVVGVLPRGPQVAVTLLATDPVALADVQRDLPGGLRPSTVSLVSRASPVAREDLATGRTTSPSVLPVVVSAGTAAVGDHLGLLVMGSPVSARVVAVLAAMPAAPQDGPWVLLPLAGLRAATGFILSSQSMLASLDPGQVPSQAVLGSAVGDIVTADTPDGVASAATRAPLAAAVQAGLPEAFLLGGAMTGAAVLLGLVAGSRRRSRFLAQLRALGLSSGQSHAVVAVEVTAPALAALAAGPACGLTLGALLLPVADLRPLIDSVPPPAVIVPGTVVAAIVLLTAGLVAVGVLVAAAAGRTLSPAAAARLDDRGVMQ